MFLIVDWFLIFIHLQEDEEENFVLTALCRAIEDGDLDSVKQVLSEAKNFNINQTNKVSAMLIVILNNLAGWQIASSSDIQTYIYIYIYIFSCCYFY